ncbi:MAG: CBS domain-containing protein [candidate division Zixibacteria bacterium]|nr:CBS domain-containing protein [candidate division Zixibacteria bacterium]
MDKIREIIKDHELYFVNVGQTVKDAVSIMAEKNIGAICVLDGDHLVGMFTERDLMRRVVNTERLNAANTKIEDVMTKDLIIAESDETVKSALAKMKKYKIRHMPVVENKKLIGIVSMRDLLLHDLSVKEEEIKLLDAYITYSPMRME